MRLLKAVLLPFILVIPLFLPAQENRNLFEISKNLDIFSTLYKQLDLNYVDEVKPGSLMKTGIDAMLATLDPYTNYIPESEIEDYRFMTTGQYGGIGAMVHKDGDDIVISEPYKNFPADKAGLKAGDKILEINGNVTASRSVDEVSTILKGQPGTSLKLKVKRGNEKAFVVEVNRETIQIENIPYYGMLDDHTGYLLMNSFTQHAGNEVREAVQKMMKQDMKTLIFDLRGNGGGLLNEAVNIANLFIPKDQLIVSTKGRLPTSNATYKTTGAPLDEKIPLVFLVDKNSASASEILAGSMQDLDRAVIIGQRSYGKGLVQNVLPLTYNSQVKVTVAKYYIPSGRCIQAIDYSHKDDEGNFGHIPDSLINEFKTRNGRVVYDGGGIEPDVVMPPEKLSGISQVLLQKFFIFNYVTEFCRQHDSIDPPGDFELTDGIYKEFLAYLKDKDYSDYLSKGEYELAHIKAAAEKEQYYESIRPEYEALKAKILKSKENDLTLFAGEIRELLKDEIVRRYYYQKGSIVASLATDPEILKAKEVLDSPDIYQGILKGTLTFRDSLKEK